MPYTPENNPYIPGDPYSYDLKWLVAEIKKTNTKLAQLIESYGMPIVVDTAAEMTDPNKIYIYIGSEPGYTSGDWYYYDEYTHLWTSGGSYGGYPIDSALNSASTNAVENRAIYNAIQTVNGNITTLANNVQSDINTVNSRITSLANRDYLYNTFHNKVVVVLGDSLTIGSGASLGNTWIEKLASEYGATVYNYGISGSKISTGGSGQTADDMSLRIDSILAAHSNCDFFVLMGGANDKNQNVKIGSPSSVDRNDFIGAISQIIVKVRRKYKETCKLFTMTTYHRYDDFNTIGLCEYDYVKAMQYISGIYGVPCFNNYNDCGISLADTPYDGGGAPYAWADIGTYTGGTTKNYHFSPLAYDYLFPIYASFLANGYINNPSERFISSGTLATGYWTRETLENGLIKITFKKTITGAALNNYFAPILYVSTVTETAPNGFGLTQILSAKASATGDGFPMCFLNGSQENGNIKYVPARVGDNTVTAFNGAVYIELIGLGPV